MRSQQQLIHLFKEAEYIIRKMFCTGCRVNHPSQTEHSICLTNQDTDIYTPKAIRYLVATHDLSWDEMTILKRELCVESPMV